MVNPGEGYSGIHLSTCLSLRNFWKIKFWGASFRTKSHFASFLQGTQRSPIPAFHSSLANTWHFITFSTCHWGLLSSTGKLLSKVSLGYFLWVLFPDFPKWVKDSIVKFHVSLPCRNPQLLACFLYKTAKSGASSAVLAYGRPSVRVYTLQPQKH